MVLGGDDWNEVELKNKFISPLIVFSGIDNKKFAYFLERELSATIQDYELFGKVDGMIASGFRSPKKTLFLLTRIQKANRPQWRSSWAMLDCYASSPNLKPRPTSSFWLLYYWQALAFFGTTRQGICIK